MDQHPENQNDQLGPEEGQVHTLEQRLEDRKVMDRAKGKLMDQHSLSEAEAFARMQRQAMDARTTMRAVADTILAGADAAP